MTKRRQSGRGAKGFDLQYQAPGPVALRYITSDKRVKVIMGPVGSGKTRAMMFDGITRAFAQPPSPIDGIRRDRTASVRHTYRQLWKSTIESWHKIVPPDEGEWTGGKDQPASHRLFMHHPSNDGTMVEYLRDFIALGDKGIEEACRGYEVNDWELDELDTLPDDVLSYCVTRIGRYPDAIHDGPWWWGVRAATNAFDIDSQFYDQLIENLPAEWAFFRQPGGLERGAENIKNLVPTYYQDQMVGQQPAHIRKFVHNQFGYSRDGKPVYAEFRDEIHVATRPLQPIPVRALLIGVDAGRTPAAVFVQRDAWGRWLVLFELVCVDMGARTFGGQINQVLRERFPGFSAISGWGDPAASHKGDQDENTWLSVLGDETKIVFRPAPVPNNNLTIRLEAVRQPLSRLIDGQPGILLSPDCKALRRGFNSAYRYKKVFVGGATVRYVDTPDKNDASHPHDALQYVLLGGGEHLEVLGRQRHRHTAGQQFQAKTDFGVFT